MKEVILTGLRANNDLHIGNYFGAMKPIITMAQQRASDYQVNMFIPDLHSFTTPIVYGKPLYESIINNARLYAAAGLPLDIDTIMLYRQSYIAAHSELTWLLDCFTGMGQLERMTQFKDKSTKLGGDHISVGLFNYPVLMAADILLYNATYIPVGEDQTQHLEFARDIAERMNSRFGTLFTVPAPVTQQHAFFGTGQGLRIKDLLDPSKKMSKSDETGNGVVFLNDTPERARQKIMRATTDSFRCVRYDIDQQPGITNLLDILALLRNRSSQDVARQYAGMSNYGEFKQMVADEMVQFLTSFQYALATVDLSEVERKLTVSEEIMNRQAQSILVRVQRAIGIRP